jgi:hypothetical protein
MAASVATKLFATRRPAGSVLSAVQPSSSVHAAVRPAKAWSVAIPSVCEIAATTACGPSGYAPSIVLTRATASEP